MAKKCHVPCFCMGEDVSKIFLDAVGVYISLISSVITFIGLTEEKQNLVIFILKISLFVVCVLFLLFYSYRVFKKIKYIFYVRLRKLYKTGCASFDYSNHNGAFSIGDSAYSFETRWTKGSDAAIYAYNDAGNIDAIALVRAPVDMDTVAIQNLDLDFSSRCRLPQIGDAIVWKNKNGKYAITKIVNIQDNTRGHAKDELCIEYLIFK